jgi:polysaccharide export outer membrane protein
MLLFAGTPVVQVQASGSKSDAVAAPAPAANLQDYRLGAGDHIRVMTFNEASLTGEFEISSAGTISLPLIGDVHAAGATTVDLQNRITAALKDGFINNPSVSVQVLTYRPFYILGEVNKPGQYPYTSAATVLNAVATATGFTYRANTHKVMIKHAGDAVEKLYLLDASTEVSPGDTIRILERHF